VLRSTLAQLPFVVVSVWQGLELLEFRHNGWLLQIARQSFDRSEEDACGPTPKAFFQLLPVLLETAKQLLRRLKGE